METLPQRHRMGSALVLAGASHHPNYWIAGARPRPRRWRARSRLPEAAGRDYVMQGPELVTYEEAAQRYVRAKGNGMRVVRLPLVAAALARAFLASMRYNARILRTVLRYPEEFKAEDDLARSGQAHHHDRGVRQERVKRAAIAKFMMLQRLCSWLSEGAGLCSRPTHDAKKRAMGVKWP